MGRCASIGVLLWRNETVFGLLLTVSCVQFPCSITKFVSSGLRRGVRSGLRRWYAICCFSSAPQHGEAGTKAWTKDCRDPAFRSQVLYRRGDGAERNAADLFGYADLTGIASEVEASLRRRRVDGESGVDVEVIEYGGQNELVSRQQRPAGAGCLGEQMLIEERKFACGVLILRFVRCTIDGAACSGVVFHLCTPSPARGFSVSADIQE